MNRVVPLIVLALFSATPGLVAQADRTADHEALKKLREEVVQAFNKLDMKAFRACFGPSFAFTGADQAVASSEKDLQAYYSKWFEGDGALLEKIELSAEADKLTEFTGADTGFAVGSAQCRYHLTAGTTVDIPARWSATMQKIDGKWKVITAHLGVDVLDNPVMAARIWFWQLCAAGAGLGGLVLGMILGKILGRGKRSA